MMKILIVCEKLDTGGVETRILTTSKYWSMMGHLVYVASAGGRLVTELAQYGVLHIVLPLNDNANALENISLLRKFVHKESIDILHIHPYSSLVPGVLAAWLEDRPFVLTVHGPRNNWRWALWKRFFVGGFIDSFLKMAFSRASAVIGISPEVMRYLSQTLFLPSDHTVLIPNGVDTQRYHLTPLPPSPFRFLIASRLDQDKLGSIINAIQFFSYYKRQVENDAVLWIAGEGTAEKTVEKNLQGLIKEYGPNSAKMLGPQNRLWEIIPQCHGVMGLGRVIIEAGMCGRIPIISWTDGVHGVVSPDNIASFAESNFTGRNHPSVSMEITCHDIRAYTWDRLEMTCAMFTQKYSAELWAKHEIEILQRSIDEYKGTDDETVKNLVLDLLQTSHQMAARFPAAHRRWFKLLQRLQDRNRR